MLWTKTKTRLWSLEWDVYMYINIKHTYMGTSWEKFWCCWKWLWWESKSTWEDLFTSSPWLLSLRSCLWWLRFQLGTIHWLIIFSQPFFSFLVFLSLFFVIYIISLKLREVGSFSNQSELEILFWHLTCMSLSLWYWLFLIRILHSNSQHVCGNQTREYYH